MSEASKASVFIDADNYYIDYGNSDIYERYPDLDWMIYRRSYEYPDLSISAQSDSKINLFLSLQQEAAYTIQVKTQGDTATISYTFDAISYEGKDKVWTTEPRTYEEYNYETGQYETKTDYHWPIEDIRHSKEYAAITQTLTITDFAPEKFQSITFDRHIFHSWQAFADFVAANPDFYKNTTEGNDTIIGIHEANHINARGGDDTVTTKEGNDTVNGGAGNDIIHTGDGDDKLDGGTGADKLYGGRGDDTYYVDNTADQVIEYADQGNDTVYSSVSHTLATNVENLVLTSNANIFGAGNNSDNSLTGNEGNNRLNSGRGNDTVYGKGGNDTLNGGEGHDHLDGGDGDDTVNGEAGNDTLIGGKGKDSLNGGTGDDNYIYTKGDGDDLITDASGIDTLTFKGGINLDDLSIYAVKTRQGTDWEISIADTADVITIKNQVNANGAYAIDQFVLGNATFDATKLALYASDEIMNTTINGTRLNDTLTGTIGNDTIDGKAGADKMSGGRGDDTYIVDNLGDTVIELADQGLDTVISSVSHTLATNVEDLILTGNTHIFGAGNNSDNTIKGNDGNNRLNSGRGNDTVYGGAGHDVINTGDGDDYAYGGSGNDTLNGGSGNDTLEGGEGNDTYLFGIGYGADKVIDNQGNNTVRFDKGVTLADLHIETIANIEGGKDWLVSIKNSNDVLTIANQQTNNGSHAVEHFEIDGTRYHAEQLDKMFSLSKQADTNHNNTPVLNIYDRIGSYVYEPEERSLNLDSLAIILQKNGLIDENSQILIDVTGLTQGAFYIDNGNKREHFTGGTVSQAQLKTIYHSHYKIDEVIDWANAPAAKAQTIQYQVMDGERNITLSGTYTFANLVRVRESSSFEGTDQADYFHLTDARLTDQKTVHTGAGNDSVIDYSGNNTIYAGAGNDIIHSAGQIYGEAGDDHLTGADPVYDYFFGGDFGTYWMQSTDTIALYGGDGHDTLDGYATLMNGGNGNDTLIISGMPLAVDWNDPERISMAPHIDKAHFLKTVGTHAQGGEGDDTFIIKEFLPWMTSFSDSVNHTIRDESGHDTLKFTDGLSIKDLSTKVNTDGSWSVTHDLYRGSNVSLIVTLQGNEIETFTFDDGSSYTAAQFLALTQKAQAGAALGLDAGSNHISHSSSALVAGTVATVNTAKLAALTTTDSTSNGNRLLDSSSTDVHTLDSRLSTLTGNTASDTTAFAAVNNGVDSLSYAPVGSIATNDKPADHTAV